MKIRNIFLGALLFCSCARAPMAEINTAKLNIDGRTRSFLIRNSGNEDLVIEDYISSCECTISNLKKRQRLQPRDSLEVKLTIQPAKIGSGDMVVLMLKTNATPKIRSLHLKL